VTLRLFVEPYRTLDFRVVCVYVRAAPTWPVARGSGICYPNDSRHTRELAIGILTARLAGQRCALLYHIGSPQSKEGNDRLEEKIDLILLALDKDAKKEIAKLDRAYLRD
jgi:hypothetical protein